MDYRISFFKYLVLLISVLNIVSCTSVPHRTGTIVINKFETKGYRTNNPVHVKDDVVEKLRDDLHARILQYLTMDSKLRLATDCSSGDYELTGTFEDVDAFIDSHWRLVTITVEQKFKVGVDVKLLRCSTKEVVVETDPDESDEDMKAIINEIAEDIIKDIRKDPTLVAKPVKSTQLN